MKAMTINKVLDSAVLVVRLRVVREAQRSVQVISCLVAGTRISVIE